jgi:hypothetical protein
LPYAHAPDHEIRPQAQADTCSFDYGFPDWADDVNITKTLPERNVGQTIWRGWNVSFATNYWNGEGEWYDYCNNRCTYDRKALKALGFYRSQLFCQHWEFGIEKNNVVPSLGPYPWPMGLGANPVSLALAVYWWQTVRFILPPALDKTPVCRRL